MKNKRIEVNEKHSKYWRDRFEQLEIAMYNKSENYYNELKNQYDVALSKVEKDIYNWYMRFSYNNNISFYEAKKLLTSNELKELRWTLDEYIKQGKENSVSKMWIKELENASAKVHIDRLEYLKIQLQNDIELIYSKQIIDTNELMKNNYSEVYYHTAYEVSKGVGVITNFVKLDDNKINKIISKPWTSDGINFSERIWGKHRAQLISELHTNLTQSIIRGENPQKLINLISNKFNVSKNQASNLIMTESAFFASESRKNCFNDLGIELYEIVATLDLKTSSICRGLDGKTFNLDDYEVGITAPPFHNFCRTTTCPYYNDEFTVGEERVARDKEGNIYYVPANMKYDEWYEKYVKSSEEGVLAEKKLKNAYADKNQYEKYKEILGKEIPNNFDKFQELKYNNSKEWNRLKSNYIDTKRYNKIIHETNNLNIKGIPIKNIDRINLNEYKFDYRHINNERQHGVTKDMAQEFINNSKAAFSRWNGQVIVYVSDNGCSVVNMKNKIVSTSYKNNEYDDKFKELMEVLKND